jgi:hypothetical protein
MKAARVVGVIGKIFLKDKTFYLFLLSNATK